MARKSKSPLAVVQTDDIWYCAVHKMRTFVQEDEAEDEYFRPSVIIVVDMITGMILTVGIVREPVSAQEVYNTLVGVMLNPPKEFGASAHRPEEIHFEDETLVKNLQPLLAEAQVTVRFQPHREQMDEIIQVLDKSAFGDDADELPGLLKQRGVTPEQLGSLFAAALDFYRVEPWVQLSNDDILSVQVKGQKSPYFVIVMGQGGEEYGLSVFRNWKEVGSFFAATDPVEMIPRGGRHAFLYNSPPFVSFDDLDAIDTYGWELPAPDVVPTPVVYLTNKMKRPDAAMLHWYEAALRAIPAFVSDHLKTKPDGSHPPVEADLEVESSAGIKQVHIRYPGGDLTALENNLTRTMDFLEEAEMIEETGLPTFDQRGMEGMMAQFSAGMGAVSPSNDPALQKAQQIMYDAWEERIPARRIALAKKALRTSTNCADAHVLLAEEEAQTPRQALDHYQAGVDAGRRALGEDFFADPGNIGHYWGILETRPFMRAMAGLATTQWEMGNREEAERNYREMLRLNPGDNQGIRYLLLSLLMDMGRDEPARALLHQYKGDWSADMAYTSALLEFREKADSPKSKQALLRAIEVNKHVPDYLTGKKRIPSLRSDMITMGGEDEAANYASAYLNHWRKTPGAIDWLRSNYGKRK